MAPQTVDTGGLAKRFASAFAVGIPSVAAIIFGFPWFDLLVAAVAFALVWEWAGLCGRGRRDEWRLAVGTAACLAAVGLAAGGRYALALVAVAIGVAVTYGIGHAFHRGEAALTALGVAYVGVPCVAFVWLRSGASPDPYSGGVLVMWLVAVVIATDIGGYVFGRALGGPRLAPRISPKKTWAGLIGGAVLAAGTGAVAVAAARGASPAGLGAGGTAAASAALALVAQGGDLLESAAKRHYGVKDMGSMIPGHGGAFDRLDGHLAAGVAVAVTGLIIGGEFLAWR